MHSALQQDSENLSFKFQINSTKFTKPFSLSFLCNFSFTSSFLSLQNLEREATINSEIQTILRSLLDSSPKALFTTTSWNSMANNQNQKPLIYAFVSRGTVILAEFTEFSGNFNSIAFQCLQKLPSSNNKFTYNCDAHTFNYLIDNGYSTYVIPFDLVIFCTHRVYLYAQLFVIFICSIIYMLSNCCMQTLNHSITVRFNIYIRLFCFAWFLIVCSVAVWIGRSNESHVH